MDKEWATMSLFHSGESHIQTSTGTAGEGTVWFMPLETPQPGRNHGEVEATSPSTGVQVHNALTIVSRL